MVLGSLLGIVFGASSLYLFLKVGMTVSASIPVAVLAITIFRGLSRAFGIRRATILENNIVQTAGSAGESIAFGVGATMPALMLLGYDLEWTRVMLVAVLGGLLGILMMIPLRRAFIVKQHGVLPYPEGTACAKVLIVGEQGGLERPDGVPGLRDRVCLSDPDAGVQVLVRRMAEGDHRHHGLQQGGRVARALADAAGRWLHHRPSNRVGHGRPAASLTALLLVPMIAYFGDGLPGVLPPGQQRGSPTWSAGAISVNTSATSAPARSPPAAS